MVLTATASKAVRAAVSSASSARLERGRGVVIISIQGAACSAVAAAPAAIAAASPGAVEAAFKALTAAAKLLRAVLSALRAPAEGAPGPG